jgi:hypothetical protein
VIRHLQTVCLSQNAQLQKKAKREFETLTIDKNQSLIVFNKRFNGLKATYLERGGVLTNEEAIIMYFDAIAMIDDAHINGSILFMKQQFQLDPSQFALHQVQSDLQMIEDQIITQRKLAASAPRYQTNTTYPAHRNANQGASRYANASQASNTS